MTTYWYVITPTSKWLHTYGAKASYFIVHIANKVLYIPVDPTLSAAA